MAVLDLYKHLAQAAGAHADEQGVLEQTINGVTSKVTVAKKALRLPTQEFLKNPDWDTYVAFHPLCELVTHGESEVLQRLKGLMMFRFNLVISELMTALVEIAADTSLHKTLSAKASKFLSLIPIADQTTVKNVNKILDLVGYTPKHTLVGMYLKRPGTMCGKTFNRVSVMKFPLITENDPTTRTIFGVKVRIDDFESLLKLYKYIVGIEESTEVHNCGSNDTVAPYLQVVMGSWFSLAKHLNKLLTMYSKQRPELADMVFDTSWEEMIKPENLAKLYNEIPALDGNRGIPTKGSEEVEAEAVDKITKGKRADRLASLAADNIEQISTTNQPAPLTIAPTAPAPVVAQPQQPATQQNKNYNTVSDLMRPAQQAQPQMVQVMQPVMMANGAVVQQPVLVPAQPVQQPQVVYQQPVQQPVYQQPQMMYQQPQQNAWPAFQQQQQQPMQPQFMPQQGARVNDLLYRQPQMMQGFQQPVQQQFVQYQQPVQNGWPAFR